jgi:UDP:flavonoid glycosyltransferase YjiC (YdhE family)
MLDHLQQLGHVVKVVSYDRGYRNLKEDFDVFETEGLHIASSDNRVSKVKTFRDNIQRRPRGHKKLNALRKDIFKTFLPDCVITDFEPMRGQFEQELNAHWLAKLNYGINLRRIRAEAVGNFLYRVPDFKEHLNDYRAVDNSAIKDKLGELLEES